MHCFHVCLHEDSHWLTICISSTNSTTFTQFNWSYILRWLYAGTTREVEPEWSWQDWHRSRNRWNYISSYYPWSVSLGVAVALVVGSSCLNLWNRILHSTKWLPSMRILITRSNSQNLHGFPGFIVCTVSSSAEGMELTGGRLWER